MTYPRPLFRRAHWRSLDGSWQFASSPAADVQDVSLDQTIEVPYAPETPRSGVHDEGFHPVLWYRQTFTLSAADLPGDGERLLLHFGAVDWACRVWVNGVFAAEHHGGYTPFDLDVTPLLAGAELSVTVRVEDDPHDLHLPRGKQDWQLQPHVIWYPRTSGIWQSVWLEKVPAVRLHHLRCTPDLPNFALKLDVETTETTAPLQLRSRVLWRGQVLFEGTSRLGGTHTALTLALPDPGFDDLRADYLWSPEHPQLLDLTLELLGEDGAVLDTVQSYTALRSVETAHGRFLLNGHPYPLRLVLDQGYWTEGGLSATDDELRRDVELTKQLGFNGARKHQKIEDPRYLYWADTLGLLVWEELPSAYAFSPRSVERLTQTWTAAIRRDASHPCIAVWVPFNESWGVTDLARDKRHRDLVKSLYHLAHALDGTRPVIGNDGWEHTVSDIFSIHDYTADPGVIRQRYTTLLGVQQALEDFWPAGRQLALSDYVQHGQPIMLTEFGGIAYFTDGGEGWGYSTANDAQSFLERYQALLEGVHDARLLTGFCYTQLTDTYQERNGLLDMARRPKADLGALAAATLGRPAEHTPSLDASGYNARWRQAQAATKGEL